MGNPAVAFHRLCNTNCSSRDTENNDTNTWFIVLHVFIEFFIYCIIMNKRQTFSCRLCNEDDYFHQTCIKHKKKILIQPQTIFKLILNK